MIPGHRDHRVKKVRLEQQARREQKAIPEQTEHRAVNGTTVQE